MNTPANRLIAIVVVYQLREGAMPAFLTLAIDHAAKTMREDSNCLRYDVVESAGNSVIFYEVYTDAAAHSRHLQSAHLAAFRKERERLVATINEYHGSIIKAVECSNYA